MWCPRCDQGFVVMVEVVKTKKRLFVCKECDASWFDRASVGTGDYIDFGTWMLTQGLTPLWSEVIELPGQA